MLTPYAKIAWKRWYKGQAIRRRISRQLAVRRLKDADTKPT
jgi:hypothetical protein